MKTKAIARENTGKQKSTQQLKGYTLGAEVVNTQRHKNGKII